jgi:ribosomal protein L37AE/L43A
MAIKPAEGVMTCPECGFPDAHVKRAKTGFFYRWCPECSAQYFARTPENSARLALLSGIGREKNSVTGTESVSVIVPAKKSVEEFFNLGGM